MRPETKAGIGFIGAFSIVMIGIILSIGVTPARAEVKLPPAKYRVEPTKPYKLRMVSRSEVGRQCAVELNNEYIIRAAQGRKATKITLNGCHVDKGTWSLVLIANDMNPTDTARTIVHEKGHVNGWRH